MANPHGHDQMAAEEFIAMQAEDRIEKELSVEALVKANMDTDLQSNSETHETDWEMQTPTVSMYPAGSMNSWALH